MTAAGSEVIEELKRVSSRVLGLQILIRSMERGKGYEPEILLLTGVESGSVICQNYKRLRSVRILRRKFAKNTFNAHGR